MRAQAEKKKMELIAAQKLKEEAELRAQILRMREARDKLAVDK